MHFYVYARNLNLCSVVASAIIDDGKNTPRIRSTLNSYARRMGVGLHPSPEGRGFSPTHDKSLLPRSL